MTDVEAALVVLRWQRDDFLREAERLTNSAAESRLKADHADHEAEALHDRIGQLQAAIDILKG